MSGARTDFLSTAPVAAATAVVILLAVVAWPLFALTEQAVDSELLSSVRRDENLRDAFLWAFGQAAIASALGVIFGLASAYCWARLRYPGRTFWRALSVAPLAIPAVVLAIGVKALFASGMPGSSLVAFVGLEPSVLQIGTGAVILTHALVATAAVGWLAGVAWTSVDARRVDAARTLGAGPLRAARAAVFPTVAPAALAGAGIAFIQATISYGAVAVLARERETPEGLAVRLVLSGDGRAAMVAFVTSSYVLLFGLMAIQVLRSPTLEPRRTRRLESPRGVDRVAILVASVPGILVLGAALSMALRAVDSGDGFTTAHIRSLVVGQHAGATREAALGSALAALPAAALAAIWGGLAGAALHRMNGVGGMLRASGLLLPVALSPAALALGWRFALPEVDPRLTLPLVQSVIAFPLVAGTIARMCPRPRPAAVAAARSLGARGFRAWRVLRGPSYVIALAAGFLIAFALSLADTSGAAVTQVPGGTLSLQLLELDRLTAPGEAAALGGVILVIAVLAFVIGDPIIARLGRARR